MHAEDARSLQDSLWQLHSPLDADGVRDESHWVATLENFLKLDASWFDTWLGNTVGKHYDDTRPEYMVDGYRDRMMHMRTAAGQALGAQVVAEATYSRVLAMIDHVSSPFFDDLADVAISNLSSISNLTPLASQPFDGETGENSYPTTPSPEAASRSINELAELVASLSDHALKLGGEDRSRLWSLEPNAHSHSSAFLSL